MISLWAFVTEADVEAYASSLVLPGYLAHLQLAPFEFGRQAVNSDGLEPLRLTYSGEGRLEEFAIDPADHVVPMLRSVCPEIEISRIRLPHDDAGWHWDPSGDPPPRMRIYFEPVTRSLYGYDNSPPSPEAYVSVTRGHVFIDRATVESYIRAWLEILQIDNTSIEFSFDTPSGGVEFTTGTVGGELFLSDDVIADELIRFAGMKQALVHVSDWAQLNLDSRVPDNSQIRNDGIYIQLAKRTT